MIKRIQKLIFSTVIVVLGLWSCTNNTSSTVKVDFIDSTKATTNTTPDSLEPVYVAIASMTSPRETYKFYNHLINYISKKIGRPVYIKEKKTYEEVNEMLRKGEVSFAFICSGAYIGAKEKHEAKLLVAPLINDTTYYQAFIITQKNSGFNSFKELQGHSFAYTDPMSNTGFMYPTKLIRDLSENPDTYFSKTIFTYGHDISIQMVNNGIIDGASVHSLIYGYIAKKYPERVKNIKVINKSELFGMPPVVTPINIDTKCYNNLQQIFLEMNTDSLGKEILKNLEIQKFVKVKDNIYDNVRQLER